MWRSLLRWLTPLILTASLFAPAVLAQPSSDKKNLTPGDLRWKDDSGSTPNLPSASSHVPVAEFAVAGAGVALVLVVLCAPARKRT
jgi:hypothetical protein